MKNTKVLLEGKSLWQHSPTKLRKYCEEHQIPLKVGLKSFQLIPIVENHITKSDKSRSKDFVMEELATEKKIAAKDCKTTIKMWKLHKLGKSTEEIAEILKAHKPQHIEYFVGSYAKSEKLQRKADAIVIK